VNVELPQIPGGTVAAYVLVLCRIGPLFLLAPVFSSRMIPGRAKLIAAAAITVALAPLALKGHTVSTEPVELAFLVIKEIGVGLAFAFVIAAIGAAAQAGAALMDTLFGFSYSAIVDPISNIQNAPIGQLYSLFTAMVFVTTGGDQVMIMGLSKSYELVPVDRFPALDVLAGAAAIGIGKIFLIGLMLAAPVVIALLVADAAFALVAKAVPQMNIFQIGIPAKILLGFGVIATSLPFTATHIRGDLSSAVVAALGVLGGG
jgi:flagellar biosynthetic protein FliR